MLSKIAAAVCVVMLVLGLYGLAWSQACNVGPGKTYSDGDGVYDGADIQLALNAGANAILCQNTTYNLDEPRLTCGVGIATCFKFSNQCN